MAATRPWHQANPEAVEQLQEQIAGEFPELRFMERGDQLALAGVYPLVGNGRVVDRYHIEVRIPRNGPESGIPVVWEMAERIPRTPERHMNPDGSGCLFVPEEFWYNHPHGMDLLSFLRGPVLAFLIGQSLVEVGEPWPYGVRPHGNEGIMDFYSTLIGTKDARRVRACLEMIVAKKLRSHWPCPCGSGRSVRNCHVSTLERLRVRVPRRVAEVSLARLEGKTIPVI